MQNNNLLGILGLVFLLSSIFAIFIISSEKVEATDFLALEANIFNSDGSAADGNITIEVWDSASSGNLIYNSTNDFIGNRFRFYPIKSKLRNKLFHGYLYKRK